MKIDLSKYPPGTKLKLKNGKLAMLVGESPYRKGIYIVEYGDKGGHVDFSSHDGYIIFQDLHIESVIQPDKYLVSFLTYGQEQKTQIVEDPKRLTEKYLLGELFGPLTDDDSFFKPKGEGKTNIKDLPYKVLSWSKIEE